MSIEMRVIGTLSNIGNPEDGLIHEAMLLLDASCFRNENCSDIFKIIKARYEAGDFFDFISLLSGAPNNSIGDLLAALGDVRYYSRSSLLHDIRELAALRDHKRTEAAILRCVNLAKNEPVPSKKQEILSSGLIESRNNLAGNDCLGKSYSEITRDYQLGKHERTSFLKTGLECFEKIQNQSMITICGRSGIGKTFFAVYLMNQLLQNNPNKNALFFSLEMPHSEIWKRHVSIVANKQFAEMTEEEIYYASEKVNQLNCKVFDKPLITIDKIELICRINAQNNPLSVIVVDYLGLVAASGNYDRHDLKVADIAQRLAALSIELNTVVIALSQANRDHKHRKTGDKCPYPTDAADSSGSERSSSLWIGIDRPEVDDPCMEYMNLFLLKCRKNRNGESFEGNFRFNGGLFKERQIPNFKQHPSIEDFV
jgi:replicative DNA helicase